MNRKAAIISIKSTTLSASEMNLLKNEKPWGVILFKRNIVSFKQTKILTRKIRRCVNDPYYPIMDKSNIKMFKKYEKLMNSLSKKNIYFEGRLARYKYFNTDQVIEKALDLFNLLKFKYRKK